MNAEKTPGSKMSTELLRYFHINSRTRNLRNGRNVKASIREAIIQASTMPGYYSPEREEAFRVGFYAVMSWDKHVEGYRIDGMLAMRLRSMNPAQFALYLGRMVDAGISCTGEGETFFLDESKSAR